MMDDLHVGGVIDERTVRRFDDACLAPTRPLKPAEIKTNHRPRPNSQGSNS
jgi:DNA-binding transcriptional regulator YiaG